MAYSISYPVYWVAYEIAVIGLKKVIAVLVRNCLAELLDRDSCNSVSAFVFCLVEGVVGTLNE